MEESTGDLLLELTVGFTRPVVGPLRSRPSSNGTLPPVQERLRAEAQRREGAEGGRIEERRSRSDSGPTKVRLWLSEVSSRSSGLWPPVFVPILDDVGTAGSRRSKTRTSAVTVDGRQSFHRVLLSRPVPSGSPPVHHKTEGRGPGTMNVKPPPRP